MSHSNMNHLPRRLQLDRKRGWLGGVCAGLADYFDTDLAFMRVGVAVTALFLPKLVIASYLVTWLLLDKR